MQIFAYETNLKWTDAQQSKLAKPQTSSQSKNLKKNIIKYHNAINRLGDRETDE